MLLDEKRLKVAGSVREAETLVRERKAMRVRMGDSGRERYGACGERKHDDPAAAVGAATQSGDSLRAEGR